MGRVSKEQIENDLIRRFVNGIERIEEILRGQTAFVDNVLRALSAAPIPMFPQLSKTYNVLGTPTFLIKNESQTLLPIRIRNEDAAIFLYLGNRDIIIPAGERVDPGQTSSFVLSQGQDVWGVNSAGAGFIQVIVSVLESAYTAATSATKIIM